MRRTIRHPAAVIWSVVLCMLISSLCILAVPAAHNRHGLTMLCSGMFWSAMLIGYGMLLYVNMVRRKNKCSGRVRIGIITFFRNRLAAAADISELICIVLLIISFFAEPMQGFQQFVLFFLIVFLFHMHCILNGENFRFLLIKIRGDSK